MPSQFDGGIGESTIICDYLEDVYPQKPGLPKDPIERARSRLVARIVDLYIAPAVGPLFRQMNPATRDAAAVEKAAAEIAKTYGYAEHAMGSGPFCVGATPTLGDCALSTTTKMMKLILATVVLALWLAAEPASAYPKGAPGNGCHPKWSTCKMSSS